MTTSDRFLRIALFLALAVAIICLGAMQEFLLLLLVSAACGVHFYMARPDLERTVLEKIIIASLMVSWIVALGQLAEEFYPYFF